MAGVHRFNTLERAERFADRWNDVEAKTGKAPLAFRRDGDVLTGEVAVRGAW
jgi:hypothetical protein